MRVTFFLVLFTLVLTTSNLAQESLSVHLLQSIPFEEGTSFFNAKWSPDGRYLAVSQGGEHGGIRLYDSAYNFVYFFEVPEGEASRYFAWSPDSRFLATGGRSRSEPRTEVSLYVWYVERHTLWQTVEHFQVFVSPMEWNSAGFLGVINGYGYIDIFGFDEESEQLYQVASFAIEPTSTLVWYPNADNTLIIEGSFFSVFRFDETVGLQELRYFKDERNVGHLAIRPDGQQLLTVGLPRAIREGNETNYYAGVLYDLDESGYPVFENQRNIMPATGDIEEDNYRDYEIYSARWHPTQNWVVTRNRQSQIQLWDMNNYEMLLQFGEENLVDIFNVSLDALSWHPDGHLLAEVDPRGVVNIWELDFADAE